MVYEQAPCCYSAIYKDSLSLLDLGDFLPLLIYLELMLPLDFQCDLELAFFSECLHLPFLIFSKSPKHLLEYHSSPHICNLEELVRNLLVLVFFFRRLLLLR